MRIKEIKVEGLFDMFNHTITLNLEHRLTIVYGANGVGKTTLLRLINGIFAGSIGNHLKFFKKLQITYDNGDILYAYPDDKYNSSRPRLELQYYEKTTTVLINGPYFMHEHFYNSYKFIPTLIETERLSKISRNVIINANNEKGTKIENSATLFSAELAQTIKEKTILYRKTSDDLKNSLNQRIIEKKVKTDISLHELKAIAADVEEKKQRYKSVGLLENTNGNINIPDDLNVLDKAILAVNIQDVQKQLEVYEIDNFYERLRLFIEILNERRLSYKTISISEGDGFIFTNDKGKNILPSELSSGEQHELVLLYQLLFKFQSNSLIMIDEPEMSLHITWQKAFVYDMEEIIKLRNFDILLATHSPSIINGNWDITQSLDGYEEK
ncbi:MAG: hypothetical protein RLZZ292_1039 [Bacteroidota bacterium]|jgi:predicted ATP-binding protein involved in virulence